MELEKLIYTSFAGGESHSVALEEMKARLEALASGIARTASAEALANIKLPEALQVYRVQIEQECYADVEAYFLCKVRAAYQAMKDARKGLVN